MSVEALGKEVELDKGTTIALVSPSGESREVTVLGVERFTKCFSDATQIGILLGNQVQPEEVAIETEVWI